MNTVDVFERLDDTSDYLNGLDNPARMKTLAAIDIDNPTLREKLDAISARTARRLGVPTSLTTLVLDTAQIIPGSHGLTGWLADAAATPIEWSFCARTVATGQPYIVPDTATDPVQVDNPLVTRDGIASYAGVPLAVDGQIVGAHCVLVNEVHTFNDADLTELRAAAEEVTALLSEYRV
ncbi:GAF domain-containing protein [Actinoplanes couchii]|uniref:GAF domain-containing protein n=1 Tax=Actinoplanes couchii TaxID=403638 RepID=A0ABQ3XJ29_9ACTN|nr:GAF domain-containing protein [Actinoplanes couchii]MDR6324502.1 GAF domain-containing protein [Actinoplanes couchii]GID58498.1 hypothetical protein Aco03nite_069020 [Actinoplanes couchii]